MDVNKVFQIFFAESECNSKNISLLEYAIDSIAGLGEEESNSAIVTALESLKCQIEQKVNA